MKSVRRSCRQPRPEPPSPEGRSRPTPPRPTAPLSINQPGRTEGRSSSSSSSRETEAGAPRSPTAKAHRLKRMTKRKKLRRRRRQESGVCHPHRIFLYVLNQYFVGSVLLALISTQTWAEIHLNMVTNIQTTQGALDLSNQTFLKKPQKWTNHMQDMMSQVLLVVLFPFFPFFFVFCSKYPEYFQLLLCPGLLAAHLYSSL